MLSKAQKGTGFNMDLVVSAGLCVIVHIILFHRCDFLIDSKVYGRWTHFLRETVNEIIFPSRTVSYHVFLLRLRSFSRSGASSCSDPGSRPCNGIFSRRGCHTRKRWWCRRNGFL